MRGQADARSWNLVLKIKAINHDCLIEEVVLEPEIRSANENASGITRISSSIVEIDVDTLIGDGLRRCRGCASIILESTLKETYGAKSTAVVVIVIATIATADDQEPCCQ